MDGGVDCSQRVTWEISSIRRLYSLHHFFFGPFLTGKMANTNLQFKTKWVLLSARVSWRSCSKLTRARLRCYMKLLNPLLPFSCSFTVMLFPARSSHFTKGGKCRWVLGFDVCVCVSVCEASINVFCDTFVTMRWYKVERIAQGIQEVQQNQESPDFVSW